MEPEFKHIAIVGAGASGCMCAYFLSKADISVTVFDSKEPLTTLLPTGGGRCNLAHAEYDFKKLAQNYPRGEKFLYSIFSKFSTSDTISLFEELGIETYTQEDGRIFPKSNSSKDVRNKILNNIKNADFVKEKVEVIIPIKEGFKLITNKAQYLFSDIVIATGGHNKYITIPEHDIIPPKPSLVGLNCNTDNLCGIVLKNVFSKNLNEYGDILFTHYGISGPLIYKISSIKAQEGFPYTLSFDLCPQLDNLQEILDKNSHKLVKNIFASYFPHRFAEYISSNLAEKKGHQINRQEREFLLNKIHNYELEITGTNKGEETVTAGGYDLNKINPKTMESKLYPNLYIIGEALNIDGFCGGFNLQNAWSTAFIASNGIINKKE